MTDIQGKENMECVHQCEVGGVTKKFYVQRKDMDMMKQPTGFKITDISDARVCVECKQPVLLESHFRQHWKCHLCRYGTFCDSAFSGHVSSFHNRALKTQYNAHAQFVDQIYCNCGFATRLGNKIADHLLYCSKISCTVRLSGPKLIRNARYSMAKESSGQATDTAFHEATVIKKNPSEENSSSFIKNVLTRQEDSPATVITDAKLYKSSVGKSMHLDIDSEIATSPSPSGSTVQHQIGLNVQDWYCSACNLHVHNISHWRSHMRIHNRKDSEKTPYSCTFCNAKFSSKSVLYTHKKLHTNDQPYVCKYCGDKFRTKPSLKTHENNHMGIKPYVCSICKARFSHLKSLLVHKSVHTGEKPFACSYCNSRFRLKCHLTNHVRMHTGERPYSCSQCGATYRTHNHLARHKRTHSDERPFGCNTCDGRFKSKEKLKLHMKVHTRHKIRRHTRRSFKCKHCNLEFSNGEELSAHRKTHTPFKCEFCEMKFQKRHKLVHHVRGHTGEKPFRCNFCSTCFRTKSSLSRHVEIHTEGPFSCPYCDTTCRHRKNRDRHVKLHDKKNK